MSTSNGADLIGRLAAGVRPSAAGEPATSSGVAGAFEAMLTKAEAGVIESGLPITLARGVELQLSPMDMERLSVLVDRAQAQGASQAIVVTDQGMFELDVLRRRITGVVDPSQSGSDVLTGFDAVLRLHARSDDPAQLSGPLPLPESSLSLAGHRSLLDALGRNADLDRNAG